MSARRPTARRDAYRSPWPSRWRSWLDACMWVPLCALVLIVSGATLLTIVYAVLRLLFLPLWYAMAGVWVAMP